MIVSSQFVPAERFILRPLSAVCAIGGGAYLFSGAWSTGTLLLVMSLFIGVIGQGLPHNQRKTFQQLTQGSAADLTVERQLLFRSGDNWKSRIRMSVGGF